MQKLFNKILVPVNFSLDSVKLMKKVVDIAVEYDCSIHLLYVSDTSWLAKLSLIKRSLIVADNDKDNGEELEFLMKELCSHVNSLRNDKTIATYSVSSGKWNEAIVALVNQHKFDLVLIGQRSRLIGKRRINISPDKIAMKTNTAVMTVPLDKNITRLCSVTVPVTDFLPLRKLVYGIYISSLHNTKLNLLGIETPGTKKKVNDNLTKAYRLVKDNCNISVDLEIIVSSNSNIADAISGFAARQSTDLVIVNPVTQTKIAGLLSSLGNNILQQYIPVPVLTVNTF